MINRNDNSDDSDDEGFGNHHNNNNNNNNNSISEETEKQEIVKSGPRNSVPLANSKSSLSSSSTGGVHRSTLIPTSDDNKLWRRFLNTNETIIYSGLVIKRRGLFARKRQLILTNLPRFLYLDPFKMEFRKSIEWSSALWAEWKDEKTFYIHTTNRDYYMVPLSATAAEWVRAINKYKESLALAQIAPSSAANSH